MILYHLKFDANVKDCNVQRVFTLLYVVKVFFLYKIIKKMKLNQIQNFIIH